MENNKYNITSLKSIFDNFSFKIGIHIYPLHVYKAADSDYLHTLTFL